METKKKSSTENASVEITKEMVKQYGLVFMANFRDLTKEKPLYAGLCEYLGGINFTPLFPDVHMAEGFVELCRKYLPELENVNIKICKLSLV